MKLVLKANLLGVLASVLLGALLFLIAGDFKYWNGWLFICAFIIPMNFIRIYLVRNDPALVEKRMKIIEKNKLQGILNTLMSLGAIALFPVSGFDYRYHWSTVPNWIVVIFTIVMICGLLLLFMVVKENGYASRVIEIQEGQRLIDTGVYSVIRHPMYLAATIVFCSLPFILGSFYALIPAVCIPLLLPMRIDNEEKVLRDGLKGYDLYMNKVKYRLIPYVW
jgi:protein-S-isoprenylcysteine O-methyltransferase Ste14